MLKKLDEETISQICSNISIPSVTEIIKKLIDNSLDSKSDAIRLEIVEGGIKQIVICNNGIGIIKFWINYVKEELYQNYIILKMFLKLNL